MLENLLYLDIFFSSNGTPETNSNSKVITIGLVISHKSVNCVKATKNTPHQLSASPK